MANTLNGKHIVLGVTGSIAAYKAAVIARLLVKSGAEVQVVITPGGKEFITPLTLSTLTRNPVISEFFSARDGSWNSHVSLGQWADAMLIAPCTASTLGKMANGIADNMLLTTYFSMKAPVFIAPAMDLDMYGHLVTQRNIETLRSIGNIIIEPDSGELASQLIGKGRMQEPESILKALEDYFRTDYQLSKKKILITAGPTYEAIDPVRFIGNHSTGKMGFALAEECAAAGAGVTLITGPVNLVANHPGIDRINVTSAHEMYLEAMRCFPGSDAAILCAAVADFTPVVKSDVKIKRKGDIALQLKPTQDIAAALGAVKRPDQYLVGFALETTDEFSNAAEKMERKNLDFIVLNSLRDEGAGFGYDTNKVTIIDRESSQELPLQSKKNVAKAIVGRLAKLMLTLLLFIAPAAISSQELDPQVSVNTSKIQGTDKDVFTTMQNAMQEFLRNQVWTNYHFADNERIQCTFSFVVNTYDASTGRMECELIVQSNRPVFNSAYFTTVFNFRDQSVDFTYTEQDRLDYIPGNIDNNLTAILAYYSLLVIGLDFDTMSLYGGNDILRQAETLAANSQSLGSGWRSFDTNTSRYTIISDYLNGSLASFRQLQYQYHRKGLDDMAANADRGRATITESLALLTAAYEAKSTSALPELFTEIKRNELLNIYSKGLQKEREKVADLLSRINPSLTSDWNTIKTQ
ncbi:MAG TPA: bifunctional phosphopantothenoylcysteine decarboxylase/phosphopantothenate--cysteine ligase CoaBC [Bacteroidales bacterium]|nr:bifunctional phosphopantothenoylcysteine decarboxylase/phosphopantothenate--cysteine ligase CoaBC [Bacteroidales bacterium]